MTTPENDAATLVVPVQVDALVINEPIAKGGATWNRWQMNYEKLNTFAPPMSEPFGDEVYDAPEVGVHIHWALPDGLTHGVRKPGDAPGEFTYPYHSQPLADRPGGLEPGSGDARQRDGVGARGRRIHDRARDRGRTLSRPLLHAHRQPNPVSR